MALHLALLTQKAAETSPILHASCNSKGCFARNTFQIFAHQNARNTTGDRDPTNCKCIIIQSTFSIYKTYNTNTFILWAHRLSFPVAATVIIKSEVPGICHLVVVNLAHPRARHGLREFPKFGFFRGWSNPQAHGAAERPAGPYQVSQRLSQQQRDALNDKKSAKIGRKRLESTHAMGDVATVFLARNSWNTFPCFHLCAGTQLTARIARLKRWESQVQLSLCTQQRLSPTALVALVAWKNRDHHLEMWEMCRNTCTCFAGFALFQIFHRSSPTQPVLFNCRFHHWTSWCEPLCPIAGGKWLKDASPESLVKLLKPKKYWRIIWGKSSTVINTKLLQPGSSCSSGC